VAPVAADGAELHRLAAEATARAHAPHSGFRVGAVLEAEGGARYEGANVEFGSYGLTICAERVALVKAVTEGERRFRRLAVAESGGGPVAPCGACRQALADFGLDLVVIYPGPDGLVQRPLAELLADAFLLPG